MKIKRLIATVALSLVIALPLSAQVKFEKLDPTELIKKAAKEDKLAFVDVYATWCPPCRQMEEKVFPLENVGKMMSEHFVAAKFNADESIGKEMLNKYKLRYIPSYLIFDAEGELVVTRSGYIAPDEFIEFLQSAITKAKHP